MLLSLLVTGGVAQGTGVSGDEEGAGAAENPPVVLVMALDPAGDDPLVTTAVRAPGGQDRALGPQGVAYVNGVLEPHLVQGEVAAAASITRGYHTALLVILHPASAA